jgi:MFS family permease
LSADSISSNGADVLRWARSLAAAETSLARTDEETDTSSCSEGYILAAVATSISLLCAIVWIIWGVRSEAIIGARRYIFFSGLIWTLIFTMAIPNSLKLAESAGGDAMMSGWIVSALMFGVSVGACVVWTCNCFFKDWSVKYMRVFNFVAASFTMTGTTAYAVLAWSSPDIYALLGARFIAGFGCGIAYFAGRFFINRTSRSHEITEVNTTYALFVVCGLGFGPALATGENVLFGALCNSTPPIGRGAEYQGMVESVLFLIVAATSFPSRMDLLSRSPEALKNEAQETSVETKNKDTGDYPKMHPHARSMTICAVVKTIRDFAVASLEAATAMILEEMFGLSEMTVGLLIGFTFLLTVPLKLAFDNVSHAARKATQIRILMFFCVLGSLLLREDVGRFFAPESKYGQVGVILFADMLLFPSLFLTGAVIEGVGFRMASPEGTFFSTNNFSMATIVATGVGRSLGPPLGRAVLATPSGQTQYSYQQLMASVLALTLVELTLIDELRHFEAAPPQATPLQEKEVTEEDVNSPEQLVTSRRFVGI